MKKPEAQRKEDVVSEEEFEAILPHLLPEFRDLLIVSYDSGARPQEVKRLEARHLELDLERAKLLTKESKGKQRARVIYFPTARSLEIVRRLSEKRPKGPIFLNAKGNLWTGNAVKNAFHRLEKKIGKRYTQYSFRRTWITRKIASGVDSHIVAQLSGHAYTAMIDRHYSAVAQDHEFLLQQAKKGMQ